MKTEINKAEINKAEIFLPQFEDFLRQHFAKRKSAVPAAAQQLLESTQYSLFSGGKRFRPMLSYLVADGLSCAYERVLAFAAAVEFVHTYSLIHDDLPCMDDDDIRRGQPTNHIQFDEATALLAGDALLTEAFFIIGQHYEDVPDVGLKLCRLLSEAAGLSGMVAGQVVDISLIKDVAAAENAAAKSSAQKSQLTKEQLLNMHELKTGALIRVAAEGVAVIARADAKHTQSIKEFGRLLGLAFQLSDDVLDYDPQQLEASGFPKLIGLDQTKALLSHTTQQALNQLEIFGPEAQGLRDLVEFNFSRKK